MSHANDPSRDESPRSSHGTGDPDGRHGRDTSPFGPPASTAGRVLRGIAYAAVLAAALSAAWVLARGRSSPSATAPGAGEHDHAAMTMAGDSATPVSLSAEAARRIGVTYAGATAGALDAEVRSVGLVASDERRISAVSPRIDGWVERLHVNFTGQEVRSGEALLDIYSPMLVAAQEELILAARLARDVAGGTGDAKRSADDMLAAARRRLRYWEIPETDIERIERTGEVTRTMTLRSPVAGIVLDKNVVVGQRIMAGDNVYRVADLGVVWVEAEVFERDLAQVRPGAHVMVAVESFPGETWHGTVTFLSPTVDPATRTIRARVELPNPGLRLRPGMFATVRLSGVVRAAVVSVPRGAVLMTGQRAIVFLKAPDGRLVPRAVTTGMANDTRIEILKGLQPGDTVVSSATFLIDAESNLQSAIGGMASMPGMDMGAPKPDPAKAAAPRAGADTVDHSAHLPAPKRPPE